MGLNLNSSIDNINVMSGEQDQGDATPKALHVSTLSLSSISLQEAAYSPNTFTIQSANLTSEGETGSPCMPLPPPHHHKDSTKISFRHPFMNAVPFNPEPYSPSSA